MRAPQLYACHHCSALRIVRWMLHERIPNRFPCDRMTWQWTPERGRVRRRCRGQFVKRPYSARDYVLQREAMEITP